MSDFLFYEPRAPVTSFANRERFRPQPPTVSPIDSGNIKPVKNPGRQIKTSEYPCGTELPQGGRASPKKHTIQSHSVLQRERILVYLASIDRDELTEDKVYP